MSVTAVAPPSSPTPLYTIPAHSASPIQPTKKYSIIRVVNGVLNGNKVTGNFELVNYKKEVGGIQLTVNTVSGVEVILIQPGIGRVEELPIGKVTTYNEPRNMNAMLSEDEVAAIIEERFEVMEGLVDALLASEMRSLLITGAAGIGKTFTLEEMLERYERTKGQHWGIMGGSCSPFGLYETLYEYRNEGSVLVMDDVEVFDDKTKINIFKKALDTSKRRVIDWRSASKTLEDRGLPDSYEFKGKIVFLTNTNIYDEIARGTTLAVHLKALVSRSCVLDLGIHDVKTILLHVRNVVRKTDMLVNRGLTPEQQEEALLWLTQNQSNIAELSLRTPLYMCEYIKTNPHRWKILCNHTLLRAVPLRF
jgi:hypothetical protein